MPGSVNPAPCSARPKTLHLIPLISMQTCSSGEALVFAAAMLAQMRKALGATQLEMASLFAASPLSYSRLEKAQAPPRTKQLAKIEEALRMGPSVAE